MRESRRFCFYDQIHTTGMDIRHRQQAHAAITVGKDTTWRDYAQGAFRMRGLGAGQRIELLMTPEVERLVDDAILKCARRTGADPPKDRDALRKLRARHRAGGAPAAGWKHSPSTSPAKRRASQGALFSPGAPEPEGIEGDDDDGAPSPNDIAAWLLVNSMASEKVQFHLLCEQSLANVWRKASYIKLLGEFKADPRRSLTDVEGEDAQWLAGPRQLLDIYREQPDLDVAELSLIHI